MKDSYTFSVPLAGSPKGSLSIGVSKTGKPFARESSSKAMPFMAVVKEIARANGVTPFPGAVSVRIAFTFPRPRSHYGTGKNAGQLRTSAPATHCQKPDIDKLIRAVLDALQHVAWRDDSQVVDIAAFKFWGDVPQTKITIWRAV